MQNVSDVYFSTFQITSFRNKNIQQLQCASIKTNEVWAIKTEYKLKGKCNKNF